VNFTDDFNSKRGMEGNLAKESRSTCIPSDHGPARGKRQTTHRPCHDIDAGKKGKRVRRQRKSDRERNLRFRRRGVLNRFKRDKEQKGDLVDVKIPFDRLERLSKKRIGFQKNRVNRATSEGLFRAKKRHSRNLRKCREEDTQTAAVNGN